jgi:hypothetical protein
MIADELIGLEIAERVSGVCQTLKKNGIKPWLVKERRVPKADAGFSARTEDAPDVCQRRYDPLVPVVRLDEAGGRLIKRTRFPRAPGHPETADRGYERNGAEGVFMIFEPLGARRETIVTETRTASDYVNALKYTSDVMYPRVGKIVPLTGNLNRPTSASLYKAFPPEEAHRIAERFKRRFTPEHASWLDKEEIETGIMSGRALAEPLPDMESLKSQVKSWNPGP